MGILNAVGDFFTTKQTGQSTQIISALLAQKFSGFGQFFKDGFSYEQAAKHGYKASVWVYRCINAIGEAVGSVPWVVYKQGEDGSLTPLPGHPLEQLLARPNPFTDRKQWFQTWANHLFLSGDDYWEIVHNKETGQPHHIYSVRPDMMKPIPHPKLFLSGYRFQYEGKKVIFKPDQIIHWKFVDPLDPYTGMSPLTAAARTIETENAAINWNQTIFDNSAVPNGVLTIPADSLEQEDQQDLKKTIEQEFTKGNLHRTMVLWGGMEWKQLSLSQKDLDFLEQRIINKYEICAVHGVPPQVVGAQPDAKYNNFGIARLSFWEDTIIGLLDWVKMKLNYTLAPMWGPDIRVGYDLSEVPAMREAFKMKIDMGETLAKMFWPINAINARLGLGMEEVPWGDVAWAPASLTPLGEIPLDDEVVNDPTEEEEEEEETETVEDADEDADEDDEDEEE
jgi:HK97 family phage portal protein